MRRDAPRRCFNFPRASRGNLDLLVCPSPHEKNMKFNVVTFFTKKVIELLRNTITSIPTGDDHEVF